MAYVKRCILLILCVLISFVARPQGEGGAFFSLEEADGAWRLGFALDGLTPVDGADGVLLDVAGMACRASAVGLPSLPAASRLLLLPRGSRVRLADCRLADMDTLWLAGSRAVRPYAGAAAKDALPPVAEPDKTVYGTDAWWRDGAPVEVEDLGVMGRSQVVRVTVRPVAYNPVRRALCLTRRIAATLTVVPPAKAAPTVPEREHLVVVSRPLFRDALQPYVRWKRQMGYEVTEVYAATHKRDSVKAMLPDGCDYLLIVGDVEHLQAWLGTTRPPGFNNHVTDLYYVEFTGDYLPDALVGRWPVSDTAQLGALVRKTLRYEQASDLDTVQLKRLLLVAGTEAQSPAPTTTNGQVNYVAREARLAHPLLDTVCFRNPASAYQRAEILQEVGQGAAMLNYTAHCTEAGWTLPAVGFASVDTLACRQPMLWVNNCCRSNAFDGTCFGEQLLRKPDGGAIGVIGASNSTLWNEDYYWSVGPKLPISLMPDYDAARPGAFDCFTGRTGGVQTQGQLLAAGNLAVSAFGSPYDKFYWEIYCLLGDPTLRPWVGVPQAMDLYLTEGTPHNGDAFVYVGGLPGATVTAMQHDTVLGVGRVGEDGHLTLLLSACLDTTPLVLTATAPGYRPRIDTVDVAAAEGMAAALREVTVTDSTVACRVENVGTLPLYGVRVLLTQPDVDSACDALIEEQEITVDTLLPHQSGYITLPVHLLVVGGQPWWQAQLVAICHDAGVLCQLTVRHAVEVTYPTVTFRLLEADGSEAHSLLPAHSYRLKTTVDVAGVEDIIRLTALRGDEVVLDQWPLDRDWSFTTPDSLTHLHIAATLTLGNYRRDYSYYLVTEPRMDGFEHGFALYPWRQGGTQPWTIDDGRARSGAIGNRQTSDLLLDVLLHQADSIIFRAKASSEAQYDKFYFSVDGVRQGYELWGESSWMTYRVALEPGRHTLRWRYVKDEGGAAGSDCVWVDDVRLPLALWDSAYGFPSPSTGIAERMAGGAWLSVYPNPTSGEVTIVCGPGCAEVILTDIYGREVYRRSVALPATLRLPALPDGIYLLRVGAEHYSKLIIRH